MARPRIPTATYRLQFHRDFTFRDAAALVPYLSRLGASHCYASPLLKARPGSRHGYDIVDHTTLNPELGSRQAFEAFIAELDRHDMGLILDIVPNHMGVGGHDNAWWLDVLENGQSSPYAGFFDIDWRPEHTELRNKVLLPFLADHYGTVLENGGLRLAFDDPRGEFSVLHNEHHFPIDPQSYPLILNPPGAAPPTVDDSVRGEWDALVVDFAELPPHRETDPERAAGRRRSQDFYKHRLAQLCGRVAAVRDHIEAQVEALNGRAGESASFDALHRLLEAQAYRLSYWRVAADEINYRRFLDNNNLAGLCSEDEEVFAATHDLIVELVTSGRVDGLRIDHPDGLYDPSAYLRRLSAALAGGTAAHAATGTGEDGPPCYLVVEKILVEGESLPQEWPVHGTTGYEFGALVDGLFIHPSSRKPLTRRYQRFTGCERDFMTLTQQARKLIMRSHLSSELTVLARQLYRLAQRRRRSRDLTFNALREALMEVLAGFPVYRTYISGAGIRPIDQGYVELAVANARERSRAVDLTPFEFLREVLLPHDSAEPTFQRDALRLVMRLQQYTPPVMVKGVEDTAFYGYFPLASLNEVGADPRRWGTTLAEFHSTNAMRRERWPHSLLTTSTHDSKRSEDLRARLAVLSEIPDHWSGRLSRWARLNRIRRTRLDTGETPSRNDEYLFYQSLLGLWPLADTTLEQRDGLRERLAEYLVKAAREAKTQTSWINPDEAYEQGLRRFVEETLSEPIARNRFLADFLPFHQRVARCGLLNSLSQTLLKLTAPGVPDIYQGNELWRFDLVDPDNRRPVDFALRQRLLASLEDVGAAPDERGALLRTLTEQMDDGRAKLFLTWRMLQLRRQRAELFQEGDYRPVEVVGSANTHVCAFARSWRGALVVVLAPRWRALLTSAEADPALEPPAWGDTAVDLSTLPCGAPLSDWLTGSQVAMPNEEGAPARLPVAQAFAHFPVAVLVRLSG